MIVYFNFFRRLEGKTAIAIGFVSKEVAEEAAGRSEQHLRNLNSDDAVIGIAVPVEIAFPQEN